MRLGGVTDPVQVPQAVLAALEIRDVATATAEDQLLGHLRNRAVLLVLDNCEHLADACALLAEQLLESCPRVRLLATSREPLAARGEVQSAVDPLPVPPRTADVAELTGSASVRLFLDRASGVLPDFELSEENHSAVADICRHLDGMPLAIELAAARVAALPLDELARRMGDRFALLTTGPRTAEARQRTLRATVDWSYRLLTDPERVLLQRLSVFRGSWTLDAVQAVAGGEPLNPAAVVDLLGRLVDRSLVVVDRTGARYHLLETIREYAAERLAESGESERIARAHAGYLIDLAERPRRSCAATGRPDGCRGSRSSGTTSTPPWPGAPRTRPTSRTPGCDWSPRWAGTGTSRPIRTAADGSPPCSPPHPAARLAARARALQALAVAGRPGACIVHPNPACAGAAGQSRELFAELGDAFRAALSDTLLAVEAIGSDDPAEAFTVLAEAEREFTRDGDAWCAALADFVRLELHAGTGDLDAATAVGHRALLAFRALGDQWGVSAIQFHLGMALHHAGRLARGAGHVRGRARQRPGRRTGEHRPVRHGRRRARHSAARRRRPGRAAVRRLPRGGPPTRRRRQPAGRGR